MEVHCITRASLLLNLVHLHIQLLDRSHQSGSRLPMACEHQKLCEAVLICLSGWLLKRLGKDVCMMCLHAMQICKMYWYLMQERCHSSLFLAAVAWKCVRISCWSACPDDLRGVVACHADLQDPSLALWQWQAREGKP
eukprot:1160280-Pelagomonas_calceolata.AAC.2